MPNALAYFILAIISYLLGSVNFSIIASSSLGKDIRDLGSGNAGLTNYYRIFGTKLFLLVLIGDIGKCLLAVLLSGYLYGVTGKLIAGFFVLIGHIFPAFYGFRGGKGVLTIFALILSIDWRVALICLAIFAVIVLFTRYVSLGSIIGLGFLPFCMALFHPDNPPYIYAAAVVAAIAIFMHRKNIGRLLHGTESKISLTGKKMKPDNRINNSI